MKRIVNALSKLNWGTTAFAVFVLCATTVIVRAQAPAGPNRPAEVPDGYVITPSGYFHPSCVLRLAEGETLLAGGRIVRHADGTTESIPACAYPRYTASGELVTAGAARVEPPTVSCIGTTPSWVECASATTNTQYGELDATWTVPPTPISNDGQTLFFFPGLQDVDDFASILQPVLAWNNDFPGAWSIASWNCCPNGITVESTPVNANPGDQIQGTVRSTCSVGTLSCPTWDVTTSDVPAGISTELSNTPSEGQTFNWAFAGALEVYNLVQCSDYPSNGSATFSNVNLYDYNFNQIFNQDWSFNVTAGLTPQCSYGGQVAPTQVTLDYSSFVTLLSFNGSDNGAVPIGPLVQGLDGNLYGTASTGGINSDGTLFGITTGGTPTVLYSFSGIDGARPVGGLTVANNGYFYGTTTSGGGSGGEGTVFEFTPVTLVTPVYVFTGSNGNPQDAPVQGTDGNFYGTTYGSRGGVGTVFKITPAGTPTTLYTFCSSPDGLCTDGENTYAGLVQATNGDFYGTTFTLGAYGYGTVFQITSTGTLTTLRSFNGSDGANPVGTLIQATDGNFYGTTDGGGTEGHGTIFKITPNGTLTTLHNFLGSTDGSAPVAGLVQATDGNLYGVASAAGFYGYGTVFEISTKGSLITVLHSFSGPDGANPAGTLIQATDGNLYGTTQNGGPYNSGTVFRLSVGLAPFIETLPTSDRVGKTIQILGTNLTDATSVTFDGTPAAFTIVSSSQISAKVPTGAKTGKVQVVTPSGTLTSNASFRVK